MDNAARSTGETPPVSPVSPTHPANGGVEAGKPPLAQATTKADAIASHVLPARLTEAASPGATLGGRALPESSAKSRLGTYAAPAAVITSALAEIGMEREGAALAGEIRTTLATTRRTRIPPPAVITATQLQMFLRAQGRPMPAVFSGMGESEEIAILWRGCRADQLVKMVRHHSAGGVPCDIAVNAPPYERAGAQVGESLSLPEFTSNPAIAEQFGKGIVVAVFAIPKRYLQEGSVSEQGWVCERAAPVELLAWKEGEPLQKLSPTAPLGGPRIHRAVPLHIPR